MAALGLGLAVGERTKTISPIMAGAIRLLLLTGCRKPDVLSPRWSFIDFERGYLRRPDSKTKGRHPHLIADPIKATADRIAGAIAGAMEPAKGKT